MHREFVQDSAKRGTALRILFVILYLFVVPAWAGELAVTVVDAEGHPVPQAVVTLFPHDRDQAPVLAKGAQPLVVDQVKETFVPAIQILRPGGTVLFRNSDRVRHHVYSFSATRTFEFVLAAGESSPALVLPKVGVITIGCNIHDRMVAYLFVTDAPYAALTAEAGTVSFSELKDGVYTARIFHPRQRRNPLPSEQEVSVGAMGAGLRFTLSLLPDRLHDRSPERGGY